MGRLGAFLNLMYAFVGLVAAPVSDADYRNVLKALDGNFKKTQYPLIRERAIRGSSIGYNVSPSPRIGVGHRDVLSVWKTEFAFAAVKADGYGQTHPAGNFRVEIMIGVK